MTQKREAVSVWKAGDCDWVLASSEKEARSVMASYCDELGDDAEVRPLTEKELDSHNYWEDPYGGHDPKKTFREKLQELRAAGEDKPGPFAVSEF